MISLSKLHTAKKRVGRGISAGGGKTAGRGTKGQNSRSGKKRHSGFTTGASPLQMRLPKVDGNKPVTIYYTVTTDQLDTSIDPKVKITIDILEKAGLIPRARASKSIIKVVVGKKQANSYQLDSTIAHSKKVAVVNAKI